MKSKNKIIYTLLGAILFMAIGCTKVLDEHPYTVYSTDYFKTAEGIRAGVVACYSGQRYNYGPEGTVCIAHVGTDEWTYADQVRASSQQPDFLSAGTYNSSFTSANGALTTPWNRNYSQINLCNAIIQYAPDVIFSTNRVTDSIQRCTAIAEVRFLRASYYMLLVPQFGAVPVDLGSGDFKFNENPFQGFNRLPVADVLVKDYQGMIDDCIYATQNLPIAKATTNYRLSRAAAYHLLAKAYLFRAYSSVAQTTDFQNAYTAAMEVINNQATYGVALLPAYADVHRPGNDYNTEILWAVERIPGNINANELNNPGGIGGTKGIDATNDFNPDYTSVRAPLVSSTVSPCGTRSLLYGRPIRRLCPTPWTFNVAFADKDNDSRFDGTFRMQYLATQAVTGFAIGDTGFIMAKSNRIADSINALSPRKPYRIIAPREFYFIGGTFTSNIYPCMNKYDDPNKGAANDGGGRPFPAAKLSELYLFAAEAAMATGNISGAGGAMELINVLKKRAVTRTGLSTNQIKDIVKSSPLGAAAVSGTTLSAAEIQRRYDLIKITDASQITLDFILDERTRELCGESVRWPDLAGRNKLVSRVQAFNSDASANVQPWHNLRPIPLTQLNAIDDPDKTKYQNPGYN